MEADPDKTWIAEPPEGKGRKPAALPQVHKTPVIPPSKADIKFMEAWNTRQPVVYPYKLPELEITVTRSGSNQEEQLVLHSTPKQNSSSGRASQAARRKRRAGTSKINSSGTATSSEQEQINVNNAEQSDPLNTLYPDAPIREFAPGSMPSPITLVFEHETRSQALPRKDQQPDSTSASRIDRIHRNCINEELPKELRELLPHIQCQKKCSCCVKGTQRIIRVLDRCSKDVRELSVEKETLFNRAFKLEALYQRAGKEKDALNLKLKQKEVELRAKDEKIRQLEDCMRKFVSAGGKTKDNFTRLLDQVDEIGNLLESVSVGTLKDRENSAWEQATRIKEFVDNIPSPDPTLKTEIQNMRAQVEMMKLRKGPGKVKTGGNASEAVKDVRIQQPREMESGKENIKPLENRKEVLKKDPHIAGPESAK